LHLSPLAEKLGRIRTVPLVPRNNPGRIILMSDAPFLFSVVGFFKFI
jgi:hypothetical protein